MTGQSQHKRHQFASKHSDQNAHRRRARSVAEARRQPGLPDLRRRRRRYRRRRSLRRVRRLRVSSLPAVLRVRAQGRESVCPQCKTRYKRHKGSPQIRGEEEDDVDDVNDLNYKQNQKQEMGERMIGWRYGQGDAIRPAKYDSGELPRSSKYDSRELPRSSKYDSGELPRNHIPLLTHRPELSGELPSASSDRMMSPDVDGRRRGLLSYQSPNQSREFSSGFGNVAWKERVDGWRMKQDKNVPLPMINGAASHSPSEGRGAMDFDAASDYMDDSLLNQVGGPSVILYIMRGVGQNFPNNMLQRTFFLLVKVIVPKLMSSTNM